jgi:hypothetical protein
MIKSLSLSDLLAEAHLTTAFVVDTRLLVEIAVWVSKNPTFENCFYLKRLVDKWERN